MSKGVLMYRGFTRNLASKRLSDSFANSSVAQKRQHNRLSCRLDVSLKDLDTTWDTEVKCIDVSPGGMGIEFTEEEIIQLFIRDRLEMWIHLVDGLKPVHRYGRLMWLKQVGEYRYRGGIRFERYGG